MEETDIRSRRTRRWLVSYPRAAPLAIFLLIAAVTALSVFAIERGDHRRDEASLNETAKAIASAIERRGNTSSAYLRAGAALFGTVETVPPSLFRRFVSELRLDSDYRGAEGIGWAEAIGPEQVAEYSRRIASETAGAARPIRPAPGGGRGQLTPVTYLLPDTERNRRAIGYDMYSEAVRRAAMDEAERAVRPTASGRVTLVQEQGEASPGFLIYMPVFDQVSEARRLKGFLYSPFNARDFLTSALQLETRNNMGVRLYDGAAKPENLLAAMAPGERSGRSIVEPVMIANRPMTLEVASTRGPLLSMLSMLTLLFGLLVASLLMVVARLLTQQAIEDQASLEWLAEQNSIRDTLTRELNHRVKNTLANVLSIVSLTRRRARNLDEFAEGLDGRIRALSATHDLLTQSDWGTTPIGSVIEAELAPYARAEGSLELAGPRVELAPNDALSLGLAIHELATNAGKYGALSVPTGKVRVTWALDREDLVSVRWVETGGPPVPAERPRGFGTDLIEKIVAHELRHPVDLSFQPGGVTCTLWVPVRVRSEFEIRARRRAETGK